MSIHHVHAATTTVAQDVCILNTKCNDNSCTRCILTMTCNDNSCTRCVLNKKCNDNSCTRCILNTTCNDNMHNAYSQHDIHSTVLWKWPMLCTFKQQS